MFDRIVRSLFPDRDISVSANGRPTEPEPGIDYEDERIPRPARECIRSILARLSEVQRALDREAIPDVAAIDVARTRDVHLPTLVRSYIDIPTEHRSEIFRRTGRSASFVLTDSLQQMLRHLETTLQDLARHDIDAFTTNVRFVANRFSDGEDVFR